MTKHAELIARLEAAEVGSQELDEAIHDAIGLAKERQCIAGLSDEVGGLWMYRFEGCAPQSAFRCTTSLDAALALAERVLPKCRCITERDHDGTGWACVRASEDADRFMADAKTPALALCIAILKALDAKHD